ncbi:hypothetical protein ABFB09_02960 [Dehalogenimonas sp. THU2]|uniref:hypothetical protein n=1 Tax=Dehalogenimonas sp. THU2 TaxID=3151121 RepID=UPI0032183284
MVENTGKALHADPVRPVDLPEPVIVEEAAGGRPIAVTGKGRQTVAAIEDAWRIDDEWWRAEPLSRLYYAVIMASGRRLTIYNDLVTGRWYRQNY